MSASNGKDSRSMMYVEPGVYVIQDKDRGAIFRGTLEECFKVMNWRTPPPEARPPAWKERIEQLEAFVERIYLSHGHLDQTALYKDAKKLMTHAPESTPEWYERKLREIATLRYPEMDRSPQMHERIEETIRLKVERFAVELQERRLQPEFELEQPLSYPAAAATIARQQRQQPPELAIGQS